MVSSGRSSPRPVTWWSAWKDRSNAVLSSLAATCKGAPSLSSSTLMLPTATPGHAMRTCLAAPSVPKA
eukprot:13693141-Alexandrium_andersonii.AAC.1